MDNSGTSRLPPRVVRVPPPEGQMVSRALFVGLAILALAGGVVLAIFMANIGGVFVALGGLALGAFFIWIQHSVNSDYRRKRAEFVATLEGTEPDPLAAEITALWPRPLKVPPTAKIREVVDKHGESEPPRAHLVCLGLLDVPEIEEEFFEPEIITPTRAIGNQLWFVPAALIVLAVFFLQIIGVIPRRTFNIGGFAYILMMGVSAMIIWVWRSAIRPTYIRMAPGVIQVLEYFHGRRKPTIRSYPLEAGTLVVARGHLTNRKQDHLTLVLRRGEHNDKLEFWRMRKRKEIIARAWQALLSTAPTPPLSEEDLIG